MHEAEATPDRLSVTSMLQCTIWAFEVVLMAFGLKLKPVRSGNASSHSARTGPKARASPTARTHDETTPRPRRHHLRDGAPKGGNTRDLRARQGAQRDGLRSEAEAQAGDVS